MKNSMHTTEKESQFWWHWQNLKADSRKKLLHGRAWLQHRRTRSELALEWAIPTSLWSISLQLGGEYQLQCSVACLLFGIWMHLDSIPLLRRWKLTDDYHAHEISFSVYAWSLHWRFFADPDEHHVSTPKWRDGRFDIPDFFLGGSKYSNVDGTAIPTTITMPEGDYAATITPFEQTWKRPRWPKTKQNRGMRVEVEGGIPIPGKGEDSWNCENSAYISIGTSAMTVEDAVADVIRKVNARRERYGGKNWLPATGKEQ